MITKLAFSSVLVLHFHTGNVIPEEFSFASEPRGAGVAVLRAERTSSSVRIAFQRAPHDETWSFHGRDIFRAPRLRHGSRL